ncbi:MAG TPA: NapC/NirT family cytochrome c [Bacteroidales bacterium]|nr:NapC/NirT family cytochrome c [Bacteroidales bacterium]HPF03979.1 NapC/NirT family cytochrome c [Bacteroidales bacterium]HPJ59913.1 NapC/NirT family cytochrome c [Bacteroidales bacterium]HPR12301.1 NapC/NirT family cytochrome c [Bacteroidales bacterium]
MEKLKNPLFLYYVIPSLFAMFVLSAFAISGRVAEDNLKSRYSYKDFESSKKCRSCHPGTYEQWSQAMMSEAYTHHWDEIEYFDLAVRHSEAKPDLKEAVDGCNGCHTPLAYMSEKKFPPPRPAEKSMANESVSCEACHLIQGSRTDPAYNFSYILEPGMTKYAVRVPGVESPAHKIVTSDFYKTTEFCGNCHNEKSPYDVWVKSTQLEWKEGPYAKENVRCQDCHMPKGGVYLNAIMTRPYDDARLHLFHGGHDPGKVRGTIELRVEPDLREAEPGETIVFQVALFNQKTGHKFPTGSVEDRIAWLHVEATDAKGKVFHLKVDKKGFEGEEYTIAGDYLAYQDMGVPLGIPDFKGVQRDGVPEGDRIYRMPYFDPEGRMTMMQWNTASLGVDYRIGPRETKVEKFTFRLPFDIAPGEMTVKAVMNYQLLVKPVADLLKVPADESEIKLVNEHFTTVNILP